MKNAFEPELYPSKRLWSNNDEKKPLNPAAFNHKVHNLRLIACIDTAYAVG